MADCGWLSLLGGACGAVAVVQEKIPVHGVGPHPRPATLRPCVPTCAARPRRCPCGTDARADTPRAQGWDWGQGLMVFELECDVRRVMRAIFPPVVVRGCRACSVAQN